MCSRVVFFILLLSLSLGSCASLKPKYQNGSFETIASTAASNLHTLYLVGDGGGVEMNENTDLLRHLKVELAGKQKSSILFLGDNLYPVGVPPKGSETYDLSIYRLQVQLDILKSFPGRIIFVPGNHDWYQYGPEGLARQEEYIDSVLSARPIIEENVKGKYFLPESGCSGPVIVELAPGIKTVVFDSQWFLESVERNNFDHCPCQTREEFKSYLASQLVEIKNETIVLAMHHPPFTYGEHGGFYDLKKQIFPLSALQKNLLFPLPITGYIYTRMRPYITVQDTKNSMNKYLVQSVLESISPYAPALIVSGHEHNLQHIEKEGHYFIVSGAGSLKTGCALEKDAQFCVGEQGYVRIDFKTSKFAIANYIVIKKDLPVLLFQRELKFN